MAEINAKLDKFKKKKKVQAAPVKFSELNFPVDDREKFFKETSGWLDDMMNWQKFVPKKRQISTMDKLIKKDKIDVKIG